MSNCALAVNKDVDDWSEHKKKFKGYDISTDVCRIGRINMLFATREIFVDNEIERRDSLKQNINEKYDIILANPPYGGDKGKKNKETATNYKDICKFNKNIEEFGVESNVKELLFMQLIMTRVKEGTGRCCIVLPEGLFFKSEKAYVETRKKLVEEYNVVEVGYASNEFENTSVNTCVVYFKNDGKKTKKVKFTDIQTGQEIITVKYDDIKNNKYVLVYNIYLVQQIKEIDDYNIFKLEDIIKINPVSKRGADFGIEEGLYRFYTCAIGTRLYCNENDYSKRSIIISSGGSEKINIDDNFSCSNHNIVCSSKNKDILIEWIYYYLQNNIHLFKILFLGTVLKNISKEHLLKINIHVPSMDEQLKVKDIYDKIYDNRIKYEKYIRDLETEIMNLPVLQEVKLKNPLEEIDDNHIEDEDNDNISINESETSIQINNKDIEVISSDNISEITKNKKEKQNNKI